MKLVTALIVWPPAIFLSLWLFLLTGPLIELRLAPIMVEASVANIHWEGNLICWTWRWRKTRAAVAVSISAYFETGRQTVNVPLFRDRDGERRPLLNSTQTFPAGVADRGYCGMLPSWARGERGIQIHGIMTYDSGLWYISQEPPVVEVPAP